MALEDLVSDLSNFKGRSQYDKLDDQIKNGVDFIPNTDAPGFTPKTDLNSLFNKLTFIITSITYPPLSQNSPINTTLLLSFRFRKFLIDLKNEALHNTWLKSYFFIFFLGHPKVSEITINLAIFFSSDVDI